MILKVIGMSKVTALLISFVASGLLEGFFKFAGYGSSGRAASSNSQTALSPWRELYVEQPLLLFHPSGGSLYSPNADGLVCRAQIIPTPDTHASGRQLIRLTRGLPIQSSGWICLILSSSWTLL